MSLLQAFHNVDVMDLGSCEAHGEETTLAWDQVMLISAHECSRTPMGDYECLSY